MLYQLSYAHHIAIARYYNTLTSFALMARPAGFEPATTRLEGGCSIQLSYGRLLSELLRATDSSLDNCSNTTRSAFVTSFRLYWVSGAHVIEFTGASQLFFAKESNR